MDAVVLEDERGSILRDPTSLTPTIYVSGVKPLRQKGSCAWKGVLVSGRFETTGKPSVIHPSHCGHGTDGDAKTAVWLDFEL